MSNSKIDLLNKYETIFEKNSSSKVFAPLAEVYRSFGDLDQAFKVLKEGFKYHPEYSLGRIILGKCYFDQGKFDLALSAINEIALQEKDNLSLQLLYARVLKNLDRLKEALSVYKLVLFINPREEEAKDFISRYEDDLLLTTDENYTQLDETPFDVPIDDWVNVDFTRDQVDTKISDTETVLNRFKKEVQSSDFEVEAAELDSSFLKQEFDFEEDTVLPDQYQYKSEVESLRLVDLYCAQGAFEKAFDLLGKLIDKNPSDTQLLKFYEELKIVIKKNLDCSPMYKLRYKLKQFSNRVKDLEYETSYY